MKRYILWIFAISASSFLFSCSKDNSAADSGGEYTGTGGSLARFTIYGEYLYTVDHQVLKTGSPIIKYIQFGERAWERRFDEVTLTPFKQLYIANYRNFALGLMGRGGIEAYIGRAQRLVFEGSLGLGFTQNWVKIKGDDMFSADRYDADELISADNRRKGLYSYLDIRIGIGYRLSGKINKK